MLQKVDTSPLHERVYQQLRRAIQAGLYAPGQSFNYRQIAEEMGTSIMPVREALNRLAAERAVDILPKRGVVIPTVTPEKFAELGRVRLNLEGMAAEMAASAATAANIEALERMEAKMAILYEEGDPWQEYVLTNYDFHFHVYGIGNPQVLLPIIESLWLQSGPLRNVYKDVGIMRNGNRHRNIIAALRRKDAMRARAAVEADLSAGFTFMCKARGWKIDF